MKNNDKWQKHQTHERGRAHLRPDLWRISGALAVLIALLLLSGPAAGRSVQASAGSPTAAPDPYAYGYNNPIKHRESTNFKPSDGCEYESCYLDDSLNPDETWITADGRVSLVDPVLAAQYPGDITWEEVAWTITGLFAIAALPVLMRHRVAWPILKKLLHGNRSRNAPSRSSVKNRGRLV